MKLLASSLLIGAATAFVPQQHVLQSAGQSARKVVDAWSKPLHDLHDSLNSLSSEARAAWDEVAMMFPDAMDKASFFSSPKKHNRRPDSQWDHIVRGSDVQSIWIENSSGEKERRVDGRLEDHTLRVKKVDPSALGVDPVKQYSGYLDDDANDKHLFYCKSLVHLKDCF